MHQTCTPVIAADRGRRLSVVTGYARVSALGGVLLTVLIGLSACGEEASPDAAIRQSVKQAVAAGEARDVSGLSELISTAYSDDYQRRYRDLIAMTTGYFLRHRNIHLYYRIDEIHLRTDDQARVRLYLATAGRPIAGPDSLFNLRARLLRVELELINEDGNWRLAAARWRQARLADFEPGGVR